MRGKEARINNRERLVMGKELQRNRYAEGWICVIDQAFSVRMAGNWPSSFLRFYGPRRSHEVEVHKNAKKKKKKERGQYPAILTEQAW